MAYGACMFNTEHDVRFFPAFSRTASNLQLLMNSKPLGNGTM
ncbi:hypothetical protein ACPOL_2656 [Acidisarcina polymorpha]|uniref:Uncharacterized protein n=1 Tax=Acidisarcina polymorpha TaxID=2211140 RepID=A0A2Z5FYM3_9BACT|nr:hypothetical protein ACPOL_2656 [Acidisarcina polymorpha]